MDNIKSDIKKEKTGEISDTLKQLQKAIENLENSVNHLHTKLVSVLKIVPETDEKVREKTCAHATPLAGTIEEKRRQILCIQDILEEIIGNCEL